jgi:hypothetical protein
MGMGMGTDADADKPDAGGVDAAAPATGAAQAKDYWQPFFSRLEELDATVLLVCRPRARGAQQDQQDGGGGCAEGGDQAANEAEEEEGPVAEPESDSTFPAPRMLASPDFLRQLKRRCDRYLALLRRRLARASSASSSASSSSRSDRGSGSGSEEKGLGAGEANSGKLAAARRRADEALSRSKFNSRALPHAPFASAAEQAAWEGRWAARIRRATELRDAKVGYMPACVLLAIDAWVACNQVEPRAH